MRKFVRIGCAGWTIPTASGRSFPEHGSHLERYSAQFNCVEINSSFYRHHLSETYARWSATVPSGFRFSVKMIRSITHEARLQSAGPILSKFIDEVAHLGDKLGCILIQLPPSLVFDRRVVQRFLQMLRRRYEGPVAIEPRNPSWFCPDADALLAAMAVGRVCADPPIVAGEGNLYSSTTYFRYHGSPRTYYSGYSQRQLNVLANKVAAAPESVWCIFDNTALGEAMPNALALGKLLRKKGK